MFAWGLQVCAKDVLKKDGSLRLNVGPAQKDWRPEMDANDFVALIQNLQSEEMPEVQVTFHRRKNMNELFAILGPATVSLRVSDWCPVNIQTNTKRTHLT